MEEDKDWTRKEICFWIIVCSILFIMAICVITNINPLVEKEYEIIGKGYENATGNGWTFVFHNQNHYVSRDVYDSYEVGDYFKCWICK